MKLIIKEYLSALRERNELDAILPDLLSQMGMNVFSTPKRGTTEHGVDIGAVGDIGDGEKVYLFSVKAGNLTRAIWDDPVHGLRSELNTIKDAYINNRLPEAHKDKDIVICLCFGGEIHVNARDSVQGYIKTNTTQNISYEEWNGDKLAGFTQNFLLNERLLLTENQSILRKSLALIDEPEAFYNHFRMLIDNLMPDENTDPGERLLLIRQLNVCLWVLFGWCRQANNYEAICRSSELGLLFGWEMTKPFHGKKDKTARSIMFCLESIITIYLVAQSEYAEKILPLTKQKHAFSIAVKSQCDVDINLKLFDALGRLALSGLWIHCMATRNFEEDTNITDDDKIQNEVILASFIQAIVDLISNNPLLLSPYKDDHVIDITLAVTTCIYPRLKLHLSAIYEPN